MMFPVPLLRCEFFAFFEFSNFLAIPKVKKNLNLTHKKPQIVAPTFDLNLSKRQIAVKYPNSGKNLKAIFHQFKIIVVREDTFDAISFKGPNSGVVLKWWPE